jgi:DNA-binding NarL/FixJ family response regulator
VGKYGSKSDEQDDLEIDPDGSGPGVTNVAIVAYDPLVGSLLEDRLNSDGIRSSSCERGSATETKSKLLLIVPPHSVPEFMGAQWQDSIRAVPVDKPLVLLSRPKLPLVSTLLGQQRAAGLAVLNAETLHDFATLVSAIQIASSGGKIVDPVFTNAERIAEGTLSAAEERVLEQLANGLSNKAISQELFLSERTVEVHIRRIFDKLHLANNPRVNRRVLAARFALGAKR